MSKSDGALAAQVYCLVLPMLTAILEHYPVELLGLRVSAIWMALRRGFVKYARDVTATKRHIELLVKAAHRKGVDFREFFKSADKDSPASPLLRLVKVAFRRLTATAFHHEHHASMFGRSMSRNIPRNITVS